MTEIGLIDWLKQQRGTAGIGDDCFVLPGTHEDLVFTTDMFVEGVHFRRDLRPEEAGHRALARGLSDVASMLAEPRFCLLSVAIPQWATESWVRRFYRGLLRLARAAKCPLSGGDVSHAGQFVADIVVCGGAPRGKAVLRSGARPGHWIYVSGELGAGARDRYRRRIKPRLDLAKELRGVATACIDITDGFSLDLYRLCSISGVAAELEEIPVAEGATEEQALSGGEDYELLFTSSQSSLPFPRVGRIVDGKPGSMMLRGTALDPAGYDHLR